MVLNASIKILLVSLLMSFAVVCCPSSIVVFKLAPHSVDLEVWKGFGGDAYGNATFRDGKFVLWVNDTDGGWGLAKICRGLMPHDWGLRYAPLDNEIIIDRNDDLKLNLEFDVKLLSYKPFTSSNSSVNVALTFFWRGFNQPYHVKCYQTQLQFFSYFGDEVKTGEKWFFTSPFGDEVAQFKIEDNLQIGVFKHYELDVMPYVKEMMTHFGLQEIQLKHVEIFVEAYKGYGAVEVYFAKISLEPTCVQNYFGFTSFLFIISLILIAIGMVIFLQNLQTEQNLIATTEYSKVDRAVCN